MIKIKVQELVNSTAALQKLSNMSLKAKLAWQVARLLKAADAEIQVFNETRMNLLKKYGEKDENDKLITDEKGNCKIVTGETEAFSNELNELLNTKIEINSNPLKFSEIENIDFTPAEISQLESFIDFEEDEEDE